MDRQLGTLDCSENFRSPSQHSLYQQGPQSPFPINRIEEEKESDEENERGEEVKDDQPYWPSI